MASAPHTSCRERQSGRRPASWRAARRTLRAAFAVVLLLAALIGPAAARAATGATLYVDQQNPNCSNSGSGTATQPFCTIGAAAAVVSAGQTVQVAAGTYTENVGVSHSGTSSAPIVFTAAPGATVTLSGGSSGFTLSSVSWVTVSGFAVTQTSTYGFNVTNASNITLSGNHVSYAGQPVSGQTRAGIQLSGVSNSLVSGNVSDHNSDYGIKVVGNSTGNELRGNQTFNNAEGWQRAAAGIRLYQSPGNVVDRNISHDNEDSGIESYPGANNTLLYDNVTYNNGDHGIDDYGVTGQRIIANTVYKNVTAGINVEGNSTGATIADNISVDNGIKSPRTHSDIRVEQGSTAGTTMDSDLVYLSSPDTLLIWNSVSYSSLAAFQAATGQEPHGLQANPLWKDPTSGDFHLIAGSPAIDSADSGVSGWPATDIEGTARIDDPATPNTGLGPVPYADRGAYEYQPVDAPPNAALTVTPSSGSALLQVTADASASSDTDATPIASYKFDFGDGSPAVGPQTGATATHTYTTAGPYTVTVTVTDTAGNSSTATAQVRVSSPGDAAPTASLTITPSSGVAPLQVNADASASSDTDATPIASYTFNFGDGSTVGPQAGATATHTYTTAGPYTVTVTVTDTAGNSSTATRQVTAYANLVGNPGFETGTSGWNTSGSASGITLTQVPGGHSGSYSAQLTNTNATNATCVLNDSPNWVAKTNPGQYTGTLWVRADTAGATLKLRFREYSTSGTLLATNTSTVTLATSWQQVSVTLPVSSPGSTFDYNAYVSNAAPGTCFYADDATIYNG